MDVAMSANSPIRMIHCHACQVTAPREESELAGPSGRICLVCGSKLITEAVAHVRGLDHAGPAWEKWVEIARGTGDALSG
jgi:hypothetical protein